MKNNVSVLIVDDNIDNLQIVSNFIQKSHRNYKISISTNGEHALNSIKRSKPDLILLDVMMPNMDGFEVCKILKKNEKTKNIPIIFLTAKEEITEQTQEPGTLDLDMKSCSSTSITANVKKWSWRGDALVGEIFVTNLAGNQLSNSISVDLPSWGDYEEVVFTSIIKTSFRASFTCSISDFPYNWFD